MWTGFFCTHSLSFAHLCTLSFDFTRNVPWLYRSLLRLVHTAATSDPKWHKISQCEVTQNGVVGPESPLLSCHATLLKISVVWRSNVYSPLHQWGLHFCICLCISLKVDIAPFYAACCSGVDTIFLLRFFWFWNALMRTKYWTLVKHKAMEFKCFQPCHKYFV